jgi:hypothetical protein
MLVSNPTDLEFATVFKDERGVVITTMKNYGKLDRLDVININLTIKHLSENKPSLRLLDARSNWSLDKSAKEQAKIEQAAGLTKARAIVVSSTIQATMMKFLQSFSKYNYPQEIFTNYDKAYTWLLELK